MAQEAKRGCGYRKVGGLYLCGEYISVPCDRLPYPLDVCPVCGGGIKVSRGFTEINPLQLFHYHQPCKDKAPHCPMCQPPAEVAYIMRVGDKFYSVETFTTEAQKLGISKRIPFIPKKLELGKTVVYLAHKKACLITVPPGLQHIMAAVGVENAVQDKLLDGPREEFQTGIFSAFVPQRIEMPMWKSQATDEALSGLSERGITPVLLEDGDPDHR